MSGAAFRFRDQGNPTSVETDLRELISKFTQLQKDRYDADYDVGRKWSRYDAQNTLDVATEVFISWKRIRKEKVAHDHLLSMFGARPN